MMATLSPTIRTFVSYSHDSEEHAQRVLTLARQLCEEGIDCHIDQFETAPPEGWPQWMSRQIADADFVLVVCTETYLNRVTGRETSGLGLGARWEGAIVTQAIYENGNLNTKFIPIVFSSGDVKFIPQFLQPTTRYDVSTPDGYESLYRRLTNQPAILKPAVGSVRRLPPKVAGPQASLKPSQPASDDELVVILASDGQHHFLPLVKAEIGEQIRLELRPADGADGLFLAQLRNTGTRTLSIAFDTLAVSGTLEGIQQRRSGGKDTWEVLLRPSQSDYGTGMEMGTTNYSADRIAEFRARRILLNERLSAVAPGASSMNNSMLEVLVRGMNTQLQVPFSPLPLLYRDNLHNPRFVECARLLAILWLRLSGSVEHVVKLNVEESQQGMLDVEFEGRRMRRYSNEDPATIRVKGECDLTRAGDSDANP